MNDFRPVGGISLSKVTGTHEALPIKDSWYEERTLHPANLKNAFCYPVIAVCQRCHVRIRLARLTQMEWTHAPAEDSATSPEAPVSQP